MDLIKMLSEPGGLYTDRGTGLTPTLYKNDRGIVYRGQVHHKFTADNPAYPMRSNRRTRRSSYGSTKLITASIWRSSTGPST